MATPGLIHGPLGQGCAHLCVDMQRLFDEGSEWAMPWLSRVVPRIEALAGRHAANTIFTRFIPARRPGEGQGTWRRYYQRWPAMTLDRIGEAKVDLVPSLARFAPPAKIVDKWVYSPWTEGRLDALLHGSGIDTLIVTGGETEVCVLASVLGAIDRGYRVIVVTDSLCSSSDATHDAQMEVYHRRYGQQVETVEMETVLSSWN